MEEAERMRHGDPGDALGPEARIHAAAASLREERTFRDDVWPPATSSEGRSHGLWRLIRAIQQELDRWFVPRDQQNVDVVRANRMGLEAFALDTDDSILVLLFWVLLDHQEGIIYVRVAPDGSLSYGAKPRSRPAPFKPIPVMGLKTLADAFFLAAGIEIEPIQKRESAPVLYPDLSPAVRARLLAERFPALVVQPRFARLVSE
jgi:hypothetical protein